MSSSPRIKMAWALVVGSSIGWPVSALTLARHEPQFVLGLSWVGIILIGVDILQTTKVREDK